MTNPQPPAPVGGTKTLRLISVTLREANAFVLAHHRHHKAVRGHKFSLGAVAEGIIVAVCIVGRPVARMNDDGETVEITRLASLGTRNACSFLYGAARRAAFALGYKRIITYILDTEPGTTLRAAGFRLIGKRGGGSWSRASRPRVDTHPTQLKLLWESAA